MSFYTVFLILGYLILASEGSTSITIPTDGESCKLRVSSISNRTNTILLDVEDDDSTMKTCIIADCYDDGQSVIVLTRNNTHTENLDTLINKHSNYIIVMNNFGPHILNDPIMQLLKRKWSYHYIIITTRDPKYNCYIDGTINDDLLIKIEMFMNDVWHKFRIVYVTLSLPYVCPGKKFKYDKKKASGRPLYNRTIIMVTHEGRITFAQLKETSEDLSKGYPLRANIFNRFPTTIRACNNLKYYMIPITKFSRGYCGLDGLIMANIVKHFQFNLSLSGSRDFGYVQLDGTTSGSLGNVLRGEVDISFSSRFVVPYVSSGMSFLHAVWTDCLCIFEKKPSDRPVWFFPAETYKLNVWLIILPMFALLGFASWVSNMVMNKYIGYKNLRTQSLSFHIWDTMLTGFLGFFIGKRPACYFLKGLCLIYSLIHVATFQGHTNYVFATRIPYPKIQTLQEVHEHGIRVYLTPGVKNLIEPPYNHIQEQVFRDNLCLRPADESRKLQLVLDSDNTAYVSRKSDGVLETLLSHTDADMEPLLSIVNECFRCYSVAYICTEGFLFEESFTLFIQRIIEAGLPSKYYTWTRLALHIPERFKTKGSRPRDTSKIELSDLRIGFSLLLTGYIVSFTAYLCEIYWARKYGISKRCSPHSS